VSELQLSQAGRWRASAWAIAVAPRTGSGLPLVNPGEKVVAAVNSGTVGFLGEWVVARREVAVVDASGAGCLTELTTARA
jgi:hypothetical protein